MNCRYAIVTPVKNEERLFEKTITSVLRQTLKPRKWIIINDGSTDRTGEIIERVASAYDWIVGIAAESADENRKPGGESVIHAGIGRLDMKGYDFFVRMDGDVSFGGDYFERLFGEFGRNSKLGIASGVCYVPYKARLVEEKHPRFHTRGPIKAYRLRCFEEIGGLERDLGWDTVDEVRANMLGWQTRSFSELKVIHHRKTQTAGGALRGMTNLGRAAYFAGYHPVFMLLRAIRHMVKPPYVIGGTYMFGGFLGSYLTKRERINDRAFIRYLRGQQLNKLLGKKTIWE